MEANLSQATPGRYLTFRLRGQAYAVAIATVREINRVSEITPVPQAPDYFEGVMNLRGKVIPVINLRPRFAMERIEFSRQTCIMVIETPVGQIGTVVDSVSGVIDLVAEQIELPQAMAFSSQNAHVTGMGKYENQVIVLLDIVRCLAEDPMIIAQTKTAVA